MMEPTPLRPDEQVAGGFLVLRLGRESFNVKVLPMRDSRKWLETAKDAIRSMRGTAEGLDGFEEIADFIAGQSEAMMDLLIAWDRLGDKVLPKREWIDSHATDDEVYEAWKRVTAATSPFVREALHIVPDLIPILIDSFRRAVAKGTTDAMLSIHSSRATSDLQPTTDGTPTSSIEPSPTSSLPSTPSRVPKDASRKRGRSRNASSTA